MTIMRVDQLLSRYGYCSRREARIWCNNERVTLSGEPLKFSDKVDVHDVRVDGEAIEHPDGLFIMLHKPVGYVCSHDSGEGERIYDLLPPQWLQREPKLNSVGRLDKDTSGLLILTDQSELVHRLTSPKHHVNKRYIATVDHALQREIVDAFASGIVLRNEPKPCLPASLQILDETTAAVEIAEGKYHQVRRMFAACGYQVQTLHRTQVGPWHLGDVAEGAFLVLPVPAAEVWQQCTE